MENKFYLGRNRPTVEVKKVKLGDYFTESTLPSLPPFATYIPAAQKTLSEMYLNDQLGDCVIAGMAHIVGVLEEQGGNPAIYSNEQIISLYSAIGGYNPNAPLVNGVNPTDQGCDEVTALNYWETEGAPKGGHKITNWLALDSTNEDEIKAAMWLFENLMFGIELPDAWITPFPSASGFVWDVAGTADPNNGHCVIGCGYNTTGVKICSWGMVGTMTWAAIKEYITNADGGALYVVLSHDAITYAKAKTPYGLNWAQLEADFNLLSSEK